MPDVTMANGGFVQTYNPLDDTAEVVVDNTTGVRTFRNLWDTDALTRAINEASRIDPARIWRTTTTTATDGVRPRETKDDIKQLVYETVTGLLRTNGYILGKVPDSYNEFEKLMESGGSAL